jgi:biotin carboxyl carrier protein
MTHRYVATVGEKQYEVAVEAIEGDRYRVTIDGKTREIEARRVESALWSLLPVEGGKGRLVDVDGKHHEYVVAASEQSIPVKLSEGRRAVAAIAARPAATGPQPVRSPMPGKVVKVLVKAGDEVKAQQGVVVVEAMKMENELKSPRDGKVVEVSAKEGQAVEAGQSLITIG